MQKLSNFIKRFVIRTLSGPEELAFEAKNLLTHKPYNKEVMVVISELYFLSKW